MTKAVYSLLLAAAATSLARADSYTVPARSNDPFDSTLGTTVTSFTPGAADPTSAFLVDSNGLDLSVVFMPDVGLGQIGYIEFTTASPVSIRGVRLFAANDAPSVSYRRAMSRFRILADLDNNGSRETVIVDSGAINPDYSVQAGNVDPRADILDLTLLNLGGTNVTASNWRLETTQGSSIPPFEGVRIIEVDALPAQVVVVTNTLDNGPGSLRQALIDVAPGGTITFAPALPGPIFVAGGELAINRDVTILGPGARNLILSGGGSNRIFNVGPVTASISGLTLENGVAASGGAISSEGLLTLASCVFSNNYAQAQGGALAGRGPDRWVITGCTFGGNLAEGAGGAFASGTINLPPQMTIEMLGRASSYTAINLNGTGTNRASVAPGAFVTLTANYSAVYTDGAGCPGCITQHYLGINGTELECRNVPGSGSINVGFNAPVAPGVYYITQTATWWFFCDQFGPPQFVHDPVYAVAMVVVGPPPLAANSAAHITNCTFSGNTARQQGGALAVNATAVVQLSHSTVAGNSAPRGGGGINVTDPNGELIVRNSIMANNSAAPGPDIAGAVTSLGHNLVGLQATGPGLTNGVNGDQVGSVEFPLDPRLTPLQDNGGFPLTHALFADSPALDAGDNAGAPALDQRGQPRIFGGVIDIGAIEMGAFPFVPIVTNTNDNGPGSLRYVVSNATSTVTFATNLSGQTILLTSGEILLARGVSIDGSALARSVRIDGNQNSRIFYVSPGATLVLDSVTITNAFTTEAGGGIKNDGTLIVRRCTFAGNHATSYGGGIENNGPLTVSGSTFFGNLGEGGGGIDNNGPLIVYHCTFFGNSSGNAPGGAIWAGGTVAMTNCTLVGNIGPLGEAGGIDQYDNAPIVIVNSIIALNTNGNIGGTFSGMNNLTSGDPLLGPLGDNGGPTATMLPWPGSPAIDAGDDFSASGLFGIDQRGFARVFGAHVDIGATESPVFIVTSTNDSGPETLRAAIAAANAWPGTNFVQLAVTGSIMLASALPDIDDSVIISGPGPTYLTLQRSPALETPDFRVLNFSTDHAELSGVTIANGRANVGGGIYMVGQLLISNCLITANTGVNSGCGGGIASRGNLTLIDSVVSGNTGEGNVFYGAGIEHNNDGEGYDLLQIIRSVISDNHCEGTGGGIFIGSGRSTISASTIAGNQSRFNGGGIFASSGELRLNESTVSRNGSGASGGGLYLSSEGFAATNSTITGNTNVNSGGGIFFSGGGGGEGEAAPLPGEGIPGIAPADDPGSVLVHCTITGNTTVDGGGGLAGEQMYEVRLRNTLLAGNLSLADSETDDYIPFEVPFVSLGHNLVGVGRVGGGLTNGVDGDLVGTVASPIDPRLGPLAENGGLTLTHAPLLDSPAINAGINDGAPALDQRGAPRIFGGVIDIGAVEFQGAPPEITCPANLSTNVGNGTDTVVSFPDPAVTGLPVPFITCVPVSGSAFALGETTVACTATNLLGTNACAFTVTVCASNITVASASNAGPGSLRQALLDACPGGTITFAPALHGGTIPLGGSELAINRDVTILGPGATNLVISGGGSSRLFNVGQVTASISGLTLADGFAASGGAISSAGELTLASCLFTNNSALAQGGALAGRGPDRWVITGCTFSANRADAVGGAFATGTINVPPDVTIEMLGRASSYTTINLNGTGTNRASVSPGAFVTLTANYSAYYTDGAGCPGCITQHYLGINGAELECRGVPGSGSINVGFNAPVTPGVYYITQTATWWFFCNQFGPPGFVDDPVYAVAVLVVGPPPPAASSVASITNCTFSGNTARQRGGALAVNATAVVQLTHSTVAGNSAPHGGGVNVTDPNGELSVRNSIIAANSATTDTDIAGRATSLGHNLVGLNSPESGLTNGVNGDLAGAAGSPLDPRLGPLQDNGGGLPTRALLAGSPAIDAGDNVGAPALDQRGAPRIFAGVIDIGAFEVQPVAPTILCPANVLACAETGAGSAGLNFAPEVTGVPEPTVVCTPASGSVFPIGTNGVSCVATNVLGTNSCTFEVVVRPVTNGVTTLADAGPGSLRDAIAIANGCPGTNYILIKVTGTIELTQPLPTLEAPMIIRGPGPNDMVIRRSPAPATPEFRILDCVSPSAELHGVTLAHGSALIGAGLRNGGVLLVSNCVITANNGNWGGCGAGVFNDGDLTVIDSAIKQNIGQGFFWGGGLDNSSSEGGEGTTKMIRCVIANNDTGDIGGGIRVGGGLVTLRQCSVTGNTAGSDGGGIILSYGMLELVDTTIAGNGSDEDGGGLYLGRDSLAATNCTISGNTNAGSGAGLFFRAAGEGGSGAGAFPQAGSPGGLAPAEDPGTVLAHCTITDNVTAGEGGGMALDGTGFQVRLLNTLIAGNLSLAGPGAADLVATDSQFVSLGHNLVGVGPVDGSLTNGVNGDLVGTAASPIDPRLGVLGDNGGLTLTHALLANSPAINAGTNAGAPPLDQRGAPRIACGIVDIGAVEFPPLPPTVICPDDIVASTDAGQCIRSNVTYTPTVMDACPDTIVSCVPPSGSSFSAGTTLVTCTASNPAGTAVCIFHVSVIAHIEASPLTLQVVEEGQNAQFCTTASGSGPFSFQWYHEGVALAGETNNCFARATINRADGGEYCVLVSSPCGMTNQCAFLVVTSTLAGPQVVFTSINQVPNDGLGQIAVIFSEAMDLATVTNLSHYRLSGGSVLRAFQPTAFPQVIVLQTSQLQCGDTYQLILTGLKDQNGRFLNPNPTIINLTTIGLAYCSQAYPLDLPAGYSLIANQLNQGENKLSEVLPDVPALTTVSLVTSNQTLDTYTFGPGGWSGDPVLSPGSGFFIYLEAPTNLIFRGSVPVPVLPLPLSSGPTLVSSQKPERASYTNVVGLPPAEGTLVYRHRPGAPPLPIGPANFLVDMFIDGRWNMAEPVAEVGQAFFVDHFEPIQIILQPASQTGLPPGSAAAFSVVATGTGPLRYQWRRNGVNLSGQTNATLMIPSAQLGDIGDYTVVVANDFDARTSLPALLRLDLPFLPLTNDFSDGVLLEAPSGVGTRNNGGATAEPFEPLHADKPGGKSMWIRWRTTVPGIATFHTTGSSFDTLLGAYGGSSVSDLVTVASDEDSGGFLTSAIQFNAMPGEIYNLAVDGLAGEEGDIVLSWEFEATMEALPAILVPPQSQVVAVGTNVEFTVTVAGATSLQWYFRGAPIPGATGPSLVIPSAGEDDLGLYFVRASQGARFADSRAAILQFNLTGEEVQQVFAVDKFPDAERSVPLQLGGAAPGGGGAPAPGVRGLPPATVVRGYTGTQVFNTTGATTSGGEEPICGVMGGASEWISFVAAEDGVLYLNTDGSSYDTVLSVYRRPPGGGLLQEIICNDNGGLDRMDSALSVSVKAGVTNFVIVDGVNSATGSLKLNYSLVTPGRLTTRGVTAQNAQKLRFTGRAGAKFSIQRTMAMVNWTTLITTNAATGVYDYTDQSSTNTRVRFYRAVMLP